MPTVATEFSTEMLQLTGNAGGGVEQLPGVTLAGGRERVFIANLALTGQPGGTVFGMARLPLYAALTDIEVFTDTAYAHSLAFGDANNTALYASVASVPTTYVATPVLWAVLPGTPITGGYDCVTGNQVTPFMPQTAGQGGMVYEDIVMVNGDDLPGSGNMVVIFRYVID